MMRTKFKFIFAILAALLIAANIPGASLAQSSQSGQVSSGQSYAAGQQGQVNTNQPPGPPAAVNSNPTGQTGRQAPQPKGGIATVVGVDQPDNCLRIRSGPGNSYDVIGCANMGDQLKITGVWTSNDWAQLADNGWVYGPQIYTDLRPPRTAYSRPPTYVVGEEAVPDYDDWAYLPDYGYDTYWYGAAPVFFYNVAVWHWCHPWWWWHGLQAWWWQDGYHGRRHWNDPSFRNFARTRGVNVAAAQRANISALNAMARTTRSASIASPNVSRFNVNRSNITSPNISRFNANRSNITSPNVTRFNSNRFRSGTSNTNRSGRTVSPNTTFRSFSSPNTTTRSFSSPNTARSFGTRSFSGSARTFSSGRVGSFSGTARAGGGARIGGGGGARMGGGGGGGRHR